MPKPVPMNQLELSNATHALTGVGKNIASAAIRGALQVIATALAEGREVRLLGFGNFDTPLRAARMSMNMHTGEKLQLAAHRGIRFKAAKQLKNSVK